MSSLVFDRFRNKDVSQLLKYPYPARSVNDTAISLTDA
nr:MAG TPA: hypothetical protein [Caudoviricetes sp.]